MLAACARLEDVFRQVQVVECAYSLSHQNDRGKAQFCFGISEEMPLFAGTHRESGNHTVYSDLLDFVEGWEGRQASIMKQLRKDRPRGARGKTPACGSSCAHPVSFAHFTCAVALLVIVFNFLFRAITRRAARDLLPLTHLALVELRDERRALGHSAQRRLQRRHHRASKENEVVDVPNSLAGSRQAQAQAQAQAFPSSHSGSVVSPQNPWLMLWHMRDRRPRIGCPKTSFGASGCLRLHGYSRAPRSAGRRRSGPAAPCFSAEGP